ncbi:MAG: M20/M25/M40 family metallo-hydrolase [Gemmatimonadota bacterium]
MPSTWTGDPTALERRLDAPPAEVAERVLARLRRYVEVETPSNDEARLGALAELLAADLEALGGRVERQPAPALGMNLLARVEGREDALEPVVILAHLDTVHPVGTLARMPFRVDEGAVRGPGVYDMKGGVAVALEALAALLAAGSAPRRPLLLALTCDEEIGSHGSEALIADVARRAAAVLVPEPCLEDGGVKTARKGVATYRLDVTGSAAHAGHEPQQGASAIHELAHQILAVLPLADGERGTRLNVGTIKGGSASNVVAAGAQALVDVRLQEPGEGGRVAAAMAALEPRDPGTSVRALLQEDRPPLVRTDAVAALYDHAREVARELGVALTEGRSGGGSDGSLAAAAGAAVLDGLGPLGGGAHADSEHVVLADLPYRVALMAGLLDTL